MIKKTSNIWLRLEVQNRKDRLQNKKGPQRRIKQVKQKGQKWNLISEKTKYIFVSD